MLQISSQEIARYVIIAVRDPLGYEEEVAAWTASFLDDARLIADSKMFIT